MIGIYRVVNPENKSYVGQSKNIEKRFKDYISPNRNQRKLHQSISKYGFEFHKLEILEECEEKLLSERERYWQEFLYSVENGLNCHYVNTATKRRKLSKETCARISNGLKGKTAYNKGIPLTKESIEKRTDKQAKVYLNTDTFIFYSFKELIYIYNKKPTTLRRFIIKSKNIIRV